MYKPIGTQAIPARALRQAKETYARLCHEYVGHCGPTQYREYVQSVIANEASLDRHVRAFEIYAPYVRSGMRVLDWGCRHAPDSCMLRSIYNDIEVFGCGVCGEGQFSEFYEYAHLSYKPLTHVFHLPYGDNEFDVVIGSGVLEHVAHEQQSLDELWLLIFTQS